MSPSTPCTGVCRLDTHGICVGCGRTIDQISAWGTLDEAERQRIMTLLHAGSLPTAGMPRIVSLLSSATEMAFVLGLGDAVVGVSHECDFPPAARSRPAVVHPALALEQMTQRQIDTEVSKRLAQGKSLYEIDEALLQQLRPDLILTQDLCQVCAPSGNQLTDAIRSLVPRPSVLAMTPHTLADIMENIQELGRATGRLVLAQELVGSYRERLARIHAAVSQEASRPRVFVMEWADPIYCSGHWVPEMIQMAGGIDVLGRIGADSVRLSWEEVIRWGPELLIVAPCGCDIDQAVKQMPTLHELPGWSTLPAVRRGQVFCVDANSYFARPGPRIVEGVELAAHLIHPALFGWSGSKDAYRAVS